MADNTWNKRNRKVIEEFRATGGRVGDDATPHLLLTTTGASVVNAQAWDDAAPAPPAMGPGANDVTLEGVTGGWPPFAYPLEASAPLVYAGFGGHPVDV